MKLSSKYNLSGRDPIAGARGSIYESFEPLEVVNAFVTGTGPGTPDVNGTPTPGTISEGHIVAMTATGSVDLATSPDLTAALSIMMFVVHSGDDDFSGSFTGQMNCFHGGARFDTEKFDTAQAYTAGTPLIAVAGILTPKVLADKKQVVGYVGPRMVVNGVLDVLMPQGVGSQY